MCDFRRTISRRHKLIDFIKKRIDEVSYDNEPIGYCWNKDCSEYKKEYHQAMKSGMLEGIAEIEKALKLIKMSIELSTEKDMKNIKNIKSKR